MYAVRIPEVNGTLEFMWRLFMKEDSPTVMFARKNAEIWRTLEILWDLLMKDDWILSCLKVELIGWNKYFILKFIF